MEGGAGSRIGGRIAAAEKECLRHSPGLDAFLKTYGDWNLLEYFDFLYSQNPTLPPETVGPLAEIVSAIFPERKVEPLSIHSRIPTPFHAGIMTEPESVQSLMMEILASARGHITPTVALLCGAVRLNTQTYPRGVLSGNKRIPFFPNDLEQCLAHACGPLDNRLLDRFIRRAKSEGLDPHYFAEAAREAIDAIPGRPFVYQAARINKTLYSRAFRSLTFTPEIFTLPLEDLTTRYLSESIQRGDVFFQMLFHPEVRAMALARFDGIKGAWRGETKGTHFFTAADKQLDQTAVLVRNRLLIGRERDFQLELEPEAVLSAIRERRLAPGVLLSLMLLTSRGFCVSGGYFQCTYFQQMIRAMQRLLKEIGEHDRGIETSAETCHLVSHGFIFLAENDAPVGIDQAIRNSNFVRNLEDAAETFSVHDGIILNMPQCYRELVPKHEQREELLLSYRESFTALGWKMSSHQSNSMQKGISENSRPQRPS